MRTIPVNVIKVYLSDYSGVLCELYAQWIRLFAHTLFYFVSLISLCRQFLILLICLSFILPGKQRRVKKQNFREFLKEERKKNTLRDNNYL